MWYVSRCAILASHRPHKNAFLLSWVNLENTLAHSVVPSNWGRIIVLSIYTRESTFPFGIWGSHKSLSNPPCTNSLRTWGTWDDSERQRRQKLMVNWRSQLCPCRMNSNDVCASGAVWVYLLVGVVVGGLSCSFIDMCFCGGCCLWLKEEKYGHPGHLSAISISWPQPSVILFI